MLFTTLPILLLFSYPVCFYYNILLAFVIVFHGCWRLR